MYVCMYDINKADENFRVYSPKVACYFSLALYTLIEKYMFFFVNVCCVYVCYLFIYFCWQLIVPQIAIKSQRRNAILSSYYHLEKHTHTHTQSFAT